MDIEVPAEERLADLVWLLRIFAQTEREGADDGRMTTLMAES